jgi:hypothetical protein
MRPQLPSGITAPGSKCGADVKEWHATTPVYFARRNRKTVATFKSPLAQRGWRHRPSSPATTPRPSRLRLGPNFGTQRSRYETRRDRRGTARWRQPLKIPTLWNGTPLRITVLRALQNRRLGVWQFSSAAIVSWKLAGQGLRTTGRRAAPSAHGVVRFARCDSHGLGNASFAFS